MKEQASIICPLQVHARKNPHHPFIISSEKIITYAEADRLASAVALKIIAADFKPHERAGVVVFPTPEHIVFLFGLWRAGIVTCLMNPQGLVEESEQSLRDINAACLFADPDLKLEEDAVCSSDHVWRYDADQDLTIMFTSGSAAQPKAVLHSWANHYYSALGSNEYIPFAPGDRWLLCLPMHHVSGLSIVFRTVTAGGTIVLGDYKNLEIVARQNITHASMVVTQLYRLLQNTNAVARLKKFKAIVLGGSTIPQTLINRSIEEGFPVHVSYGMTEMASQIATSVCIRKSEDRKKVNVLKYRQVQIKDDGEILVKGEALFKGYVSGDLLMKPFDKDGWFPTGDLGEWDSDGHLRVIGRKDNMFISGGENIHPEEIEYYLCQYPSVEQVIVVPAEDLEFGQRPVAFIQFHGGQHASATDMSGYLAQYLPKFKIPVKFLSWQDDPDIVALKPSRKYFQAIVEEWMKKDSSSDHEKR